MNVWSLVGGTVWGELGGEGLLQEVCRYGWTLRLKPWDTSDVFPTRLVIEIEEVSSQLPGLTAMPACHWTLTL